MSDIYAGREQTAAKHFILRSYLQELAFKILNTWNELAYVDGFSGPWRSSSEDFSDTSFKIAIEVLRDAQAYFRDKGQNKTIRCFLVEKDPTAYALLEKSVRPFHDPASEFLIETYGGKFEDAVPQITDFLRKSFAIVFIDPTGWTGYPFDKIGPLLSREPGEVLINFMYDHINRFAASPDPATEESLSPILGGPGWREKLDPGLPLGRAVEKRFREVLKAAGGYDFVTSTCIDKAAVDRPHFFITYGTRNDVGLRAFRDVEWRALGKHERNRADAKLRENESRTGMADLFKGHNQSSEQSLHELVEELKQEAKPLIVDLLKHSGGSMSFKRVRSHVLQVLMLRETNVKDVCVELAEEGFIQSTWTSFDGRRKKPNLEDLIVLTN